MTAASAATDAGGADAFTYTGTWGGTAPAEKWSTTAGSTATAKVNVGPGGGTVSWYGNRDTGGGKASVQVDTQTAVTVDTYDPTPPPGLDRNLYTTPWLAEGPHTLKITALGTKQTAATGVAISVKGVNTTNGEIVWPGTTTPTTPPPATGTGLDDPVVKEKALRITSTAENSTTNWTTAYTYIEDIGDGRGYTGGIVGWTSGTSDMLELLKRYRTASPGNGLEKFIDELERIDAAPYSSRPKMSHDLLDPQGFTSAWRAEGAKVAFQTAQKAERDRVYWAPALAAAKQDGVGPLGLALLYDISVNHGPGSDSQSFGGIVAGARASASKPPSAGGSEKAYLLELDRRRTAVLTQWGDNQPNGRDEAFRQLINAGEFQLEVTYFWDMYGTRFTETVNPTPR
jgi:chitosanase